MKPKMPRGYVVYRGPSMLDGKPIVMIAITASQNVKTGNMVQTYMLVDNGKSPLNNALNLLDSSVCGDCKHRRGTGGACYVNLTKGARVVADANERGCYPAIEASKLSLMLRGRMIRLGTYGDPAAVPVAVWNDLLKHAGGHTGYTHQWQHAAGQDVMGLVMASADSIAERAIAKAKGYRTFRIRTAEQPVEPGEFVCPASEEAGYKRTCDTCRACHGGIDSRKADAVIVVHGQLHARFHPETAEA